MVLYTGPDIRAAVTYYAPHLKTPAHVHEKHQFSFLLAGGLIEETPRESDIRCIPSRGIKSAGQIHSNHYGPNGALILSINVTPDQIVDLFSFPRWHWEPIASSFQDPISGGPLLRQLCKSSEREKRDIIWDLIALQFNTAEGPLDELSPRWLDQLEEQLSEAPEAADLGQIAKTHGIHRGHLSRAFKRRFGLPPSQYRSYCQVMRGIVHMMDGQRPVHAAHAAGFADQSHFSRMVDRHLGLTPGHLGALFSAAG